MTRLLYIAKIIGCHYCDYVMSYKTPPQQTELKDSASGVDEVSDNWTSPYCKKIAGGLGDLRVSSS